MLLVVVVLAFTIAMGYNALDAYRTIEEEVAAAKAISEIFLKAKMAGMGGEGMREIAVFEIKGSSRLILRNEDFGGTINGVIEVELSREGRLLKVLPLPLWDSSDPPSSNTDFLRVEKVFQSGSHRMTMTHFGFSMNSSLGGGDFLLIG
ncbi:MAG: hypothetical protein ACE5G7_02115 [Candidatus Hydrothermarchaeaceae archaeon]